MSLQPCLCPEPHNPTEHHGVFWCQACGGTVDVSRDGNAGPDAQPHDIDTSAVAAYDDPGDGQPLAPGEVEALQYEKLRQPRDNESHGRTASIRRGAQAVPENLPKTHRMLIGLAHKGLDERSMSSAELAKLTGLSAPFISQLLSGKRLGTLETWDRILDVVHFDYLGLGRFKPPTQTEARGKRRGRKPKVASFDEL